MKQIENLFIEASKRKLRFNHKGLIGVEDLWDLGVDSLDAIYKTLNSQLKKREEDSLLETRDKLDVELDMKIEIIKYIFTAKQEQARRAVEARDKAIRRRRILEELNERKEGELKELSVEDLEKELAELE